MYDKYNANRFEYSIQIINYLNKEVNPQQDRLIILATSNLEDISNDNGLIQLKLMLPTNIAELHNCEMIIYLSLYKNNTFTGYYTEFNIIQYISSTDNMPSDFDSIRNKVYSDIICM